MVEPARHPHIPDECFLYMPPKQEIRLGAIRLIFDGGVPFEQDERAKLHEFDAWLRKKHITLEAYWQDNTRLKFLQANAFDFDNTVKAMAEYITWRTKRLIVNEQHSIRKHLDQGMMYFVGRDCNYKPILVMNVKKIHDSEISTEELVNITGFFFNFIVENMMIEGQVENWVIIIELQGMGVTGVMGTIKPAMQFLSHSFRCRLKRSYMVNCPGMMSFLWRTVKGLIEEQTVKKISLHDDSKPKTILEHVNRSQIEVKYGGTMPNLTKDFWPPKHRSLEFQVGNSKSHLISKSDYNKMYTTGQLKKRKISSNLVSEVVPNSNKKVADLSSQPTFGQLGNQNQTPSQIHHLHGHSPDKQQPQQQQSRVAAQQQPQQPQQQSPVRQNSQYAQGNQAANSQQLYQPQLHPNQQSMIPPQQPNIESSHPKLPSITAHIGHQSQFRTSSHQIPSMGAVQTYSIPLPPQQPPSPTMPYPTYPQPAPQLQGYPPAGSRVQSYGYPSNQANTLGNGSRIVSQESILSQHMPPLPPGAQQMHPQPQYMPPQPHFGVPQSQLIPQLISTSPTRQSGVLYPIDSPTKLQPPTARSTGYSPNTVYSLDAQPDEGYVLPIHPTRLFLKPKNFNLLS